MYKKTGKQTIIFENPIYINAFSSVVGKKEGQGPLNNFFDIVNDDTTFGEKSWEKAEMAMQKQAFELALGKASMNTDTLDYIYAGDLLNQCIASSFAHRYTKIPYFGLYGACSTMIESLILASMAIDGGFARNTASIVSSHFCSAERQYRLPLEYGGQRPPSSQWTVTGSGCVILSLDSKKKITITAALTGYIEDLNITDANNMGAAMAPAAYNSLSQFFKDTSTLPSDYDLILTGDLGYYGSKILKKLFLENGIKLGDNYNDCGLMIFDRKKQDVHSGGSGCGCSASVLCSYVLKEMENGRYKNVLLAGTGALLSPISSLQGESIPGICHIVRLEVI